MEINRKLLVAIDDSESSDRAVTYVAQIINGRKEFQILLFHVPEPMPPQLLEFGGVENPERDAGAETQFRQAQSVKVAEMSRTVQPIFARAQSRLREAHIPEQAIKTELFMPPAEQSLDTSIVQAARAHGCNTVVVGRGAFSWLRELVQTHVADKLLQQADDLTLWIVY